MGATVSSAILALVLPVAIGSMGAIQAQPFYMQGFQTAALAVVLVMLTGAVIASFHKPHQAQTPTAPGLRGQPAGASDDA